MIKVVAKNIIKDGSADKAIDMLDEMVTKTRAEDGCIGYDLFQDVNDPNVITFIETWENNDKLSAHMESEHFKRIIPAVGELSVEPLAVNVYTQIK